MTEVSRKMQGFGLVLNFTPSGLLNTTIMNIYLSTVYISVSFEGVNNTNAVRIPSCFAYGIAVYSLLYFGQTEQLSVGLGVILVGMAVLFLVVVIELGLDWKRFGQGLIPSFPPDSANLIVSLVGTTSIGFNLFLGSSMAESSKTLGGAQRGIAFSVCGALVISVLIMIVGDGVTE